MTRARYVSLVGLVATCATAHAEPTDRRSVTELVGAARVAFDELRYREAITLLDRAWRRGDSQPAQLRTIFALAGRAAGSMGREAAAELWFQRWLCLEPAAELPAGASPKLRVLLSRARAGLAGATLAVRAVRSGSAVELTIHDPLALASSVRAGGKQTTLSSARVTLPSTRGDVELLDTYGNVVASSAIEAAIAAPSEPRPGAANGATNETANAAANAAAIDARLTRPAQPPPAVVTRDPAWHQRWWPWAIVAGGFGVVSVTGWWIADDARAKADDSGDEQEEDALERRATLATWVSIGALVGTGVAATAGVIVYVRGRETRVIASPQPGGASVAWRVAF